MTYVPTHTDRSRTSGRADLMVYIFLMPRITLFGLLLWVPLASAQAPFAPPNPHQAACIRAFDGQPESGPMAGLKQRENIQSMEDLVAWGVEEFGSREAFVQAMEEGKADHAKWMAGLLRPAADAGHLPSQYSLASYFPRTFDIPGVYTREEKNAIYQGLVAAGFPLASGLLWVEHKDNGFWPKFHPHRSPAYLIPYDQQKPEVLEKLRAAAKDRLEFFRLARLGATRGDATQWDILAAMYLKSGTMRLTKGDPYERYQRAHRIEAYAWYELEKQLWHERNPSDGLEYDHDRGLYNVPASKQAEVDSHFADEHERSEALARAETYMRVIWPRRIKIDDWSDRCRLLPQYAKDGDPYGPVAEPR